MWGCDFNFYFIYLFFYEVFIIFILFSDFFQLDVYTI